MKMIRIILATSVIVLLAFGGAHAQTAKTKSVLQSEVSSQFPDNSAGSITPASTRAVFNDFILSWQQFPQVNLQVGTTYTIQPTDSGAFVKFNAGASAVAVTLAAPSTFFNGFNVYVANSGSNNVTITTSGSTINGAATLVVSPNQSTWIVSDGTSTTNYDVWNLSTGTVTSVAFSAPGGGVFGVTGSPITSSGTLGLTATGTSGGVPYFASASTIASSNALAANGVVVGGGAGVAPASIAAGTTGQVLLGVTGSPPTMGALPLGNIASISDSTILSNFSGAGAAPSANAVATTVDWIANTTKKPLTTDQVWAAGAFSTVSFASTTTFDASTVINGTTTLTGNIATLNFTNCKAGQTGVWELKQDGTGSRTVPAAWNANFLWSGGSRPLLSTAANAIDWLFYQCKSSGAIFVSLQKGLAN